VTPEMFLRTVAQRDPAPVLLFVGPESYRRTACRRALLDKLIPPEDRDDGFVRHDLSEVSMNEVLDDACAMSLFAGSRLLWISSAELALPRGRAAAAEDDDSGPSKEGGAEALARYLKDPTPGTTLVFDSSRWDFDGEDKTKMERLRKFYAAIPAVVEFQKFTPAEARSFAQAQAAERQLLISSELLDQLVEATGADASRLANEIEKLSLYSSANGGKLTAEDIARLVADAQETTVFNLVNALAKRDREQSMALLDTLIKEGEYLPLALTFLGGIFRLALAAREQNLRTANDVQNYFQRQGMPMWRARAEQIYTAASRFPKEKLQKALELVFKADRDMKSARVDDRIVMEDFVLQLTR